MTQVLVVDDNAANRSLLVTLLHYRGHETVEACDGAEALAILNARRPELVISDILMPTMDGYEFVRQLRANPDLAATKVIFYTAHYHERDAHALAQACGVSHVLAKPCEPEIILHAIDQVLTGAPQGPANGPSAREFEREHLRLMTDKLSEKADELQVANERLAALIDLNLQLASEREAGTLLNKVCAAARELAGARYAILAVREKNESDSRLIATSGVDPELAARCASLRLDTGPLARILEKRKACRFSNNEDDPTAFGLPADFPGVRALLAAPVISLTTDYGWIFLFDKVGTGRFTVEDERIMGILAAQVGRIYENGSLFTQVQHHAAHLLLEMAERERATQELLESEERFRQLAEHIQDVFWIASPDHRELIYLSPAYEQVWGRTCESAHANPMAWTAAIHPEDLDRLATELDKTARHSSHYEVEYRIVRPDGTVRWILDRGFPVANSKGEPYRIVGVAKDITQRKEAEARIQNLDRTRAVLSGINSLIIRVRTREELFEGACRLAIDKGKFALAFVAMLDPQTEHIVPGSWAGDEEGFRQLITTRPAATPATGGGLISTALLTRKAAVCNDIAANQADMRFGAETLARGYRSAAALPFVVGDKAVGVLMLYSRVEDLFDRAEMQLLEELASDISFALDHIEKTDRLDYLAYYDALTGLANRTFFTKRLSQYIQGANRAQGKMALVVVKPERFETVADTVGRHGADELMKQIATRFVQSVGNPEDIGRLGVSDFAAVIQGVRDEAGVVRTIDEWWRQWMASAFTLGGNELRLPPKAGVAMFPTDGTDAEMLLKHAEAALKNSATTDERHVFYTQHLTERVAERLALESKLRRALENEEFVLHYQPKVDTETRRVLGVEALIRWQSPELGMVPPGRFIPLLEETGMIVDVGEWVMRQANIDRARWIERGLHAPRVAVNVSTVQLRARDFVLTVANILELTGGGTSGLDIEVTESLIMEDVDSNLEKLKAIRDMDVGIAIDDFGTGYSSLGYLARLPAETLKIDRSFISVMLDDPGAMTLVSTMITLAHALKLTVVAEGVESEEQAKILRLLRCDQLQGYLISKPLSFDDMTARLGRGRPH